MKIILNTIIIFGYIFSNLSLAIAEVVEIFQIKGEVKVRQGVEEFWQPAVLGQFIKDVDTILTGEKGEVVLKLADGTKFILGPNAILDIADLRTITDKELFIFLTREKLNKVDRNKEKTPLRIGNVSVVHGASRDSQEVLPLPADPFLITRIKNGIRALYNQEYYPNAIIKLKKIANNDDFNDECGEFEYYLGSSFEALNNLGQAIDTYNLLIEKNKEINCNNSPWVQQAKIKLQKLK
jgi:tetratricopeptide (TPR) repeat protein